MKLSSGQMLRAALSAILVVSIATPAAAYTLTDSLKDGNPKGTAVGGAYGPNGWTVQQKADRIYYVLPRLVSGSIEFTVSGITLQNLNLSDHEIFALYDGGHGISEPINYNPEFRDNHYKQLIRIYGQLVPDRLGEQKYIMLMCPDGAPGYGQCTCSKSFYDGDGWWGGNPNWDGSPTKLRIEWGNGKATYSRDGTAVWTNDYTASGLSFGPSELHFTIGCPRNSAIADSGMPIGAVFSDVVVQGTEGTQATCPGGGSGGSGGGGAGGSGGSVSCDPNNPISAVSLEPVSGAGPSGVFVARYRHCQGAQSFRIVQLLVGEPQAGTAFLAPAYEAGQLHLGSQSCTAGEAKVLTDALGSLDCQQTTVTISGNDVTVNWALAFDVGKFAGAHGVWFDAKGGSASPEPRLGWTKMGDFTVQAGSGAGGAGPGDGGWNGGAGIGQGATAGVGPGGSVVASDDAGGCACRAPRRSSRMDALIAFVSALGLVSMRRARRHR